MAMQQQLPHITILWTRYPDSRKAIFQQQLPHKSGIFAVVLLLPNARGPNLCRVSHPQFEAQLGQQALEPTGVPRTLRLSSHLNSSLLQLAIEPFGFSIAVHQPLLATFPSFRVCPSDLLYAWVIIATYNEHLGSFLPSPWSFCTTKCTQVGGSRCLHEINYPLKHARSGSDNPTVSTSPARIRPRRSRPLRSYLYVIFMRFRGPQALNDNPKNPKLPRTRSHRRVAPGVSLWERHRSPVQSDGVESPAHPA